MRTGIAGLRGSGRVGVWRTAGPSTGDQVGARLVVVGA
ncbi:hypothetical protein SAMN04489727_5107 [Amycolatopsis tolypomycina]|uniref:Uncharacterized protein n=1 Tax=Amycolatopsis tolypomycina TaxID=208445 RepID=A0A1H4VE56_9PSEU|nr:hypothetical protein SAMN04489727_5107 [Amycolatopsis tolypomycina]